MLRLPRTKPESMDEPKSTRLSNTDEDLQTTYGRTTNQKPIPNSSDVYDELSEICRDNIKYFERISNTEIEHRLLAAFQNIIDHIGIVRYCVANFITFVHEYDLDENTPANGYRSIIKITQACIDHCMAISKRIAHKRTQLLFRKTAYMKEVEAYSELLISLSKFLEQILVIREESDGSLFPPNKFPPNKYNGIGLLNRSAGINLHPFYGRCIGFHYSDSLQTNVKVFAIIMNIIAEVYYNKRSNGIATVASSMYTGCKHFWDPELRARRVVEVFQNADIDFWKAFSKVGENKRIYGIFKLFATKIKVYRRITIPPEPLEIENVIVPNTMVNIPVPSSHLGVGSVTAHLLSNVRRDGMIGEQAYSHQQSASNSLIFYFHGGGFSATNTKFHEAHLREWAVRLRVPILSIDYSLSPEAPYPRAFEEVFYAYCWAIKNANLLGTTAEKVILVGDSAGATLCMALSLNCIKLQIRPPDGILSIYGVMSMDCIPSPSRSLCIMDVITPMGVLLVCVKAYLCGEEQCSMAAEERNANEINVISYKEISRATPQKLVNEQLPKNIGSRDSKDSPSKIRCLTQRNPADYEFDISTKDPFLSPLYASDDMLKKMPPVKFVVGDLDIFLDDTIEMGKKLKRLGVPADVDVLPGLFHGFLFFIKVSKEAQGNKICISRMAELLGTTVHVNGST